LTIIDLPGDDVIDLADLIEEVDASGLMDRIGVDQAGIQDIVDAIVDRKIELERIVGIPQGWKLAGAIKTCERRLKSKEIEHAGTRLMNYCVGNALAEPKGNAVIITKQTAGTAKIDPLMAVFDAATLMGMNPKPRKKKYQLMIF
jgi:phage terminase large subunit-like protein